MTTLSLVGKKRSRAELTRLIVTHLMGLNGLQDTPILVHKVNNIPTDGVHTLKLTSSIR